MISSQSGRAKTPSGMTNAEPSPNDVPTSALPTLQCSSSELPSLPHCLFLPSHFSFQIPGLGRGGAAAVEAGWGREMRAPPPTCCLRPLFQLASQKGQTLQPLTGKLIKKNHKECSRESGHMITVRCLLNSAHYATEDMQQLLSHNLHLSLSFLSLF